MKKLNAKHDLHVFVCHGGKCSKQDAPKIRSELSKNLKQKGVKARVSRTTCQGHCKYAPVVFIEGKKSKYWGKVSVNEAAQLSSKIVTKFSRAN